MYLIFDVETTGLPSSYSAPPTDLKNWPRIVQLAWQLCDSDGKQVQSENIIIYPEGFTIPNDVIPIHGITTERAIKEGVPLVFALEKFSKAAEKASYLVAHNLSFDESVVHAEFLRCNLPVAFSNHSRICTMKSTVDYCKIAGYGGRQYKWPKLHELHLKLFDCEFEGAHDAKIDVSICAKCFFELRRKGLFKL